MSKARSHDAQPRLAFWLLLCCAALCPCKLAAQDLPAPEQLKISVITFGRGDQVHQYFGHNAFVVSAPELEAPTVFNYGMFTFGPDMIPSFLKGRLRFWMGATDLERTAAMYESHNRDVRLRELNLEPAAKLAIFKQLLHDARPENREYLYDHYFDNCSTRVRDVLDRALGGQLRRTWSAPSPFTLRQETRRYTQHDVWTEWLMMFGLNGSVDRPQTLWGNAFLPDELEHLLDTTSYRDSRGVRVPLVARKQALFLAQRPGVPGKPATRWPYTLALGLLLGAVPLLLARQARRSTRAFWRFALAAFATAYGTIAGALGSLLTSLWLFSDHLVSHRNLNLLLANPLTSIAGVLAATAMFRGAHANRAWCRIWELLGVLTLLLLALQAFSIGPQQDVSLTATLLAPANLGLALASRMLRAAARDPERSFELAASA